MVSDHRSLFVGPKVPRSNEWMVCRLSLLESKKLAFEWRMQSGKGTMPAIRGLVLAICSSCRSENGGC